MKAGQLEFISVHMLILPETLFKMIVSWKKKKKKDVRLLNRANYEYLVGTHHK